MSILNYTLAHSAKNRQEAKALAKKLQKSGFITKTKGNDVWRKYNEFGF